MYTTEGTRCEQIYYTKRTWSKLSCILFCTESFVANLNNFHIYSICVLRVNTNGEVMVESSNQIAHLYSQSVHYSLWAVTKIHIMSSHSTSNTELPYAPYKFSNCRWTVHVCWIRMQVSWMIQREPFCKTAKSKIQKLRMNWMYTMTTF